jgi:hypothetical protein
MHDIDLVQQAGTEFEWWIGDKLRSPISLPVPMPYNGKRVYFVRFCPDPMIGLLNTAHDGPLPMLSPDRMTSFEHNDMTYDLVDNGGHPEIRRISARNPRHEMFLTLSPALPDIASLRDGIELWGCFSVGVDETPEIIAGEYEVRRDGDQVHLAMQPTEKWSPRGGMLVKLTLMFFPSIFRTWVRTYRWSAAISLTAGGQAATMRSAWANTAGD